MNWKAIVAKPFFIILIFAVVIGSLPMSSMPMQAMRMDAQMTFQVVTSHNDMQGSMNGDLDGSCCDALSPSSTVCAFLLPQSDCLTVHGDSKQFSNSNPTAELIYLESLAPPPKA
jgi:hypothetical protein